MLAQLSQDSQCRGIFQQTRYRIDSDRSTRPGCTTAYIDTGRTGTHALREFILYTTIGAGTWNIILALIGYALRSVVTPEQLNSTVEHYSNELKIVIWALLGIVALFLIYRMMSHKKKVTAVPSTENEETK